MKLSNNNTVKSMTAFARITDQSSFGNITWELRSVNHRYLEINYRLPENFRHMEPQLRELLQKRMNRGKIDVILHFEPNLKATNKIVINEALLRQIQDASKELSQYFDHLGAINPLQILSWNGVIRTEEKDQEQIIAKIINIFEHTLVKLYESRETEGMALRNFLLLKFDNIFHEIEKIKAVLPDIIKRQYEKVTTFFQNMQSNLDNNRLEQEVVLLVQKLDISEEIDRLVTHAHELRKLLIQGGIIGKKMDFILQELNREANTIASKSVSNQTTYAALELKVLTEQIREQVQNIE